MVSTNTTTTSQITSEVKDIDFITKFEKRWQSLVEILGIMRPIKKMAGTKLVSSKATIVMQSGAVEEGEEIPLSQAVIEPIVYKDINLEKYRKRVTAEAVAKYGASVAVAKTDSAFVEELTSGVLDKFYAFLQSGTLTGSESDFQMALAMAVARVKDKFKKMRLDYDNIVVFANTLDVGEYLGGAKITLQNRDGIEYIKDFMGARTIIVSSEIPKGKIIATPADNIVMYYIDPSESQFEELGLEYSTGVSPLKLIGAHREGLFDRASGDIFAILGITLFAEYIDAICVMSIGSAGGGITPSLTSFKNGDVYKTGTRIIFPKSQMDNLEAFFRDRLANWTFGGDFDMLHQKGSSGGLFSIMNADGTGIFLVQSSGMDGAIWLSADMVADGQIMQAGWHTENMVDDGDNYVFTVGEGVEAEVDTETDFDGKAYLDQWNGIMIGIDNSQVSETPVTPALTAFAVGDTIEKGTTYTFDKSKGSDIEAMLNGLSYVEEDGVGVAHLLEATRPSGDSIEFTLLAINIDGIKGLFVVDGDTFVPIYATGAINVPVQATQGWNIDGDTYTITYDNRGTLVVNSILETTPAWNGVIVGLDNSQVPEAPTFLYNLVPSEMTIQENNDGSRSYIKNIDGTIDNMLLGETYNITFEVNGETLTRVGKVTEGNGMQILMNELGNGSINIIGDTTDYVSYGHYLNIGLENGAPVEGKNAPFIVTNGIYKENTPTVKVISYTKQVQ